MIKQDGEIQTAMASLPNWMTNIREAVTGAIGADDLREILRVQVEKAKKGDEKAARFVMDQAKAFADLRGVQITQNNYYGEERAGDTEPASPPRRLIPTHQPPRNPFK